MNSFDPEDGGKFFLRNVGIHLHDNTVSRPRQIQSDPHKIKSIEVKFFQAVGEK